ncbi:hypothetical protein [Pseudonocardia asaccharolytica]|uniref:Uncharacterized protein n=1 Tax=Pseudonocardia asaccharolytica DSM 44247 = NBRC 16224 TaxID=1123024 RepID=A0A511D7G0_9PSEU|nr:hypothetical protein [Pseudonocardia asaccharolytica]GEL20745.1 hypothetical protein PA7_45820 [Pseudonocardia asaccharolytica DSM 44247 = NBRC 16224]
MNVHDLHTGDGQYVDHDDVWAPDGLTPAAVDLIEAEVFAAATRERQTEPTSWLAMTEDERATVRPRCALHAVPARTATRSALLVRGGEAA